MDFCNEQDDDASPLPRMSTDERIEAATLRKAEKQRQVQVRAVIATTQPGLFELAFAPQLGRTVLLAHNSAAVFSILNENRTASLIADFRQLEDGWSGQRFVRRIRENPDLGKLPIYLMSEQWSESQRQWSLGMGATGLVERTPQAVATLVLGWLPRLSKRLLRHLDAIDMEFRRYAGPLSSTHIERARKMVNSEELDSSAEAYIDHLAGQFQSARSRNDFLASVATVDADNRSGVTSTMGDPWLRGVNGLFLKFAGGLGGKVAITQTMAAVDTTGAFRRDFYLTDLSTRLLNPARRAEFLRACREAGLVE